MRELKGEWVRREADAVGRLSLLPAAVIVFLSCSWKNLCLSFKAQIKSLFIHRGSSPACPNAPFPFGKIVYTFSSVC